MGIPVVCVCAEVLSPRWLLVADWLPLSLPLERAGGARRKQLALRPRARELDGPPANAFFATVRRVGAMRFWLGRRTSAASTGLCCCVGGAASLPRWPSGVFPADAGEGGFERFRHLLWSAGSRAVAAYRRKKSRNFLYANLQFAPSKSQYFSVNKICFIKLQTMKINFFYYNIQYIY